jgi:hypothetical protein
MAETPHSESCDGPGSRPPAIADLVHLCSALNQAGAKYVIVGGLAIIQAGFPRLTEDIDFLIETSLENEGKILDVLKLLPDAAAAELRPGDVQEYGVVRISDEVLVDLMKSGCGITYEDAIRDAVWCQIEGVGIPFASKSTLWKMKQTLREKDIPDRLFLREALAREGIAVDPPAPTADALGNLPRWIRWLLKRWLPKAP